MISKIILCLFITCVICICFDYAKKIYTSHFKNTQLEIEHPHIEEGGIYLFSDELVKIVKRDKSDIYIILGEHILKLPLCKMNNAIHIMDSNVLSYTFLFDNFLDEYERLKSKTLK